MQRILVITSMLLSCHIVTQSVSMPAVCDAIAVHGRRLDLIRYGVCKLERGDSRQRLLEVVCVI